MCIFWMDGKVERLALWMMVPDELKKEPERLCSISSSLVVVIDKEVEDPIVVRAPWLVREFGKSHHLRRRIKGVGDPDESSWTNVGFCKSNSCDRNIIRNEPLLFRKDGEAKRSTPILLCDFSQGKLVHSLLLPEYLPVVLGNKLGGEETKQGNDRESERYPIETCIERYTEHRTHKGEDRAQNHLVERIREEQNDEQRANRAKEERLSPQSHTTISRQCFNQPACFGRMQEDIEAPRASTLSIKNRWYSRRRCI
jgi:hypothetical protein